MTGSTQLRCDPINGLHSSGSGRYGNNVSDFRRMRYAIGRLGQAVLVVFVAASITFFLIQIAPGEPFTPPLDSNRVSREAAEQMRRNFGLDQPVYVQFFRYIGDLARLDFGTSIRRDTPALGAVLNAFPPVSCV